MLASTGTIPQCRVVEASLHTMLIGSIVRVSIDVFSDWLCPNWGVRTWTPTPVRQFNITFSHSSRVFQLYATRTV